MTFFPDFKPEYSSSKSSEPRVRTTVFGDGYEQRISIGLNQNPKEYSLSFNLSEEEADLVEEFLDARALDSESFEWIPPDRATVYTWVCLSWTRSMFDLGRSRINAVFQQVYEYTPSQVS